MGLTRCYKTTVFTFIATLGYEFLCLASFWRACAHA